MAKKIDVFRRYILVFDGEICYNYFRMRCAFYKKATQLKTRKKINHGEIEL